MPSGNKPAFLKPSTDKSSAKMVGVKNNKMTGAKSGSKKK